MSKTEGNVSPKFMLGQIVATPGALDALQQSGEQPNQFLRRHVTGDWGEVCTDDGRANNEAIAHESDKDKQARVLSVYKTARNVKIWIITEWDRSATTILLPEDY